MARFAYRCPVCRTTSPILPSDKHAYSEGEGHRGAYHGGHFPDGEMVAEVDRRGRWYAGLGLLATMHARIADALADLRDPDGTGHPLWATAASGLILISTAALLLALLTQGLQS